MYRNLTGQRLIALLALGALMFNYPLLALFNDANTWFGVPRLYAYLFGAWALFIGLLALIVERVERVERSERVEGIEQQPHQPHQPNNPTTTRKR